MIISTGNYNDVKYFRYKIQNDDDLAATCESIKDFMTSQGLGFLNGVTNLVILTDYSIPNRTKLPNTFTIRHIVVIKG
ncbi:MAG: hypothetical protein R2822_28565 [Spirosomataceae bacterium]